MVQAVAHGLGEVARKPNAINYVPLESQSAFHSSDKPGRFFVGGNRAGKTVAGVLEDYFWLTGNHPWLATPTPPVHGRLVTVDFKNGMDKIILPALSQWIPPSELKNGSWEDSFSRHDALLTLRNGSKLEIMSHEQPLEKFAGAARHFLHIDEECPKSIFTECKARLADYNGRWWFTMTPVEGMTWVYEDLVVGTPESVYMVQASIHDNVYISEEGMETLVGDLSEQDKRVRAHGEFVPKGGLVLREFNYERNVLNPGVPPKTWQWYVSIDAGYNNPAAILWHAVRPQDGILITFAEHYKAEWTIKMHAERIKELNQQFRKSPFLYVGDPAMAQRQQTTGLSIQVEYRQYGIPVVHGSRDVNAGIDKMNEYLRQGKWYITKECPNLLKEIRQYRWKTYTSPKMEDLNNKREEPHKKNDHAIDSCRYLFTFMPDLKPLDLNQKSPVSSQTKKDVAAIMQPGTTVDERRLKVYPWQIDPNLVNLGSQPAAHGSVELYETV